MACKGSWVRVPSAPLALSSHNVRPGQRVVRVVTAECRACGDRAYTASVDRKSCYGDASAPGKHSKLRMSRVSMRGDLGAYGLLHPARAWLARDWFADSARGPAFAQPGAIPSKKLRVRAGPVAACCARARSALLDASRNVHRSRRSDSRAMLSDQVAGKLVTGSRPEFQFLTHASPRA